MCQVEISKERKQGINEQAKKATKKDKGHTQKLKSN